jgi:enamine deaminase RidA (YjgF/YER057c/UK114 family)
MSLPLEPVNPPALAPPRGYSHGMRGAGTILFVAGQIGWDREGRLVSADFVPQFALALDNVLAVVREAGGEPASLGRLTIYVTDKRQYLGSLPEVGAAYRQRMGRHFPAMSLVEVRSLLEDGALVEIEGTAVL